MLVNKNFQLDIMDKIHHNQTTPSANRVNDPSDVLFMSRSIEVL